MQVIPRARELVNAPGDLVDPLGEDSHSPATGIVHRYPDRCLLLALDRCAIYCRHCNRRRLVGQDEAPISRGDLDGALDYIRRTPAIRDVLISGGDPLTLSTDAPRGDRRALRAIPHVEIIRIGTRVPVVLPMRIDDELVRDAAKYHPLYINTHFNHPKELTPLARAACERLADAGIPLGNQTVLLRGVNSSVRVLRKLFPELLRCRVRPYYLFQGDVAAGTSHLRTSVETGHRDHAGAARPHLGPGDPAPGDRHAGRHGQGVDRPRLRRRARPRQVDAAQLRGEAGRLPAARREGRDLRLRRSVFRKPRSPMSTLRDVAKRARVSPMTVSRVANGAPGVRPETRRRVEKAIAELGFIPNGVARGLKSSKTGALGLIVPDIVNPFFAVVVRGAETVARRAGYRLLLCISENDLTLERQYVEDMISHQVEGLLIAPVGDRSQANIQPLVQRKFPFVLMDRGVRGIDCDLVQGDNLAGARRLVRHLISIGHRRIAAIIEPDNVSTARERLEGYRDALKSAGHRPSIRELVAETSRRPRGGYSAMHQILSLHPLPTAVLAINNMTALGAMQAIRERGLKVPHDIALVCFDDVEHLAVLSPFLTVMNQPAESFGTVAAQLLLDRIAGKAGDKRRQVVLQPHLLVRESCGAKAGPPEAPEGTTRE